MGMKLMAFKCPACGQMMTEMIGPNYTPLPAPGGTVVVLTCLNAKCGQVLGTYLLPQN